MATLYQLLLLQGNIKHGYFVPDDATAREYQAWILCTRYCYCKGILSMVTLYQILLLQGSIKYGYFATAREYQVSSSQPDVQLTISQ